MVHKYALIMLVLNFQTCGHLNAIAFSCCSDVWADVVWEEAQEHNVDDDGGGGVAVFVLFSFTLSR